MLFLKSDLNLYLNKDALGCQLRYINQGEVGLLDYISLDYVDAVW